MVGLSSVSTMSESELIWKQGLCRHSQFKMKFIRWTLFQICTYKKEKFGYRLRYPEKGYVENSGCHVKIGAVLLQTQKNLRLPELEQGKEGFHSWFLRETGAATTLIPHFSLNCKMVNF